ncbi:GTP 3',8-cyclase MoaA [Corynebacterium singulare]|uniref:GTP 3',8-cyclase n=1 Tax=Corynebacterium singulare TaxID=161899 RepID=A0A0B6EV43_9CORY|nr:GTP 3',8-cyclase MoaA [Corynebacterium singulare]AJI78693.1 molybdenum cofactor biosynthesis protein A [Corynebacterium singulare]
MSDSISLPLPRVPGSADHPADLPQPGAHGERALLDRYGRQARDLRVSLTDRCNLRCTYCMPADGVEWMPTAQTLRDEETIRLIRLGVEKLGIRQVRFTGGEPLLRHSLEEIIAATKDVRTDEGVAPSTALTTNGLGLDKRLPGLQRAGLDRVNISLDTLDRELYARLTRRDRLPDVVRSIDAALSAGMDPVKINAVIMPGVNESAILPLARFCLERGAQLRFIEQMPLGPREEWDRSRMVTADDILARLREGLELRPTEEPRGSAPAALWEVKARDGSLPPGRIGVIASVTRPFCGTCDRTRLTTDGAVRNCLFGNSETSLRDLMREGASDDELAAAWAGEMWRKLPGHGVNDEGFLQPDRPMSAIGG